MRLEEIKEQVASDDNFHNWQLLFESCAMFDYGRLESAIDKVAERFVQSQTHELQEQNAELVDLVERCRDVIYAYNDYRPTAKGNEILQALQERLTKYNHLNKSHDSKRESD